MRRVEEHLAECLAAVSPLPAEDVELLDARGRVLARDVVSAVNLPAFDNSAMDGYAVRMADVAAARPDAPVRLPVVVDLPAGYGRPASIGAGTVARIMTGAPVPAGADAIVPVEWTDAGVEEVVLRRAPTPGGYLRRIGEDVRVGETVLAAGTRLGPRQLALLAAVGLARVPVIRAPRVAVLSTGSELVAPGEPLGPGQVYDSNGFGLAAAASALGATAFRVAGVPDDGPAVLAALEAALPAADVLVTSGGVSAGAFDVVKEVLERLGTVRFHKVAMQPGMPQGFGRLGPAGTPIFTLPGNPVSAMVSFEVFVAPAVRVLRGESPSGVGAFRAEAVQGWRSPAGKRQFARAVTGIRSDPDGHPVPTVRPVGKQGSHLIADLAEANCLAVVPEDVTEVQPGDLLDCRPLSEGLR